MAERIQRKRTKGWRMPEGAIYVGRPTKWGNPVVAHDGWQTAFRAVFLGFRGDKAGQTQAAVWIYRQLLTGEWRALKRDRRSWFQRTVMTIKCPPALALAEIKTELRGKDLACWCPLVDKNGNPVPCHADVLLDLANRDV